MVDKKLQRKNDILVIKFENLRNMNCQFVMKLWHLNMISCRLSTIPQLVNRGMLFVPIGHILGADKSEMEEVIGGSPFGAGTYAGSDGLREPSETELTQAFHQGKYIATITKKLKRGPQR